jgi:hypothetical protein
MLLNNEQVGIQLQQTYWRDSIFAAEDGEISPESVDVFAGVYSGEGRGGLAIETVLLNHKDAYFAAIDMREPYGYPVPEILPHGASLYWAENDVVFVLTIFAPVSEDSLVNLEMMLAIAESI